MKDGLYLEVVLVQSGRKTPYKVIQIEDLSSEIFKGVTEAITKTIMNRE